MNSTSTSRRTAIAASVVLIFGIGAAACGEDVVDDDVEREIDEDIKDFVDTAFTDTTGG